MKKIRVEADVEMEQLLEFADQWRDSNNVSLEMPDRLSEEEIGRLFTYASQILPMDFGFCVMQELAERENIPEELLLKIISLGDRGCIESVCLRKDLSPEVKKVCKEISLHKGVDKN